MITGIKIIWIQNRMILIWIATQKMHRSHGTFIAQHNSTKRGTFTFIVQSLFDGPYCNPPNIWIWSISISIQFAFLYMTKLFDLGRICNL